MLNGSARLPNPASSYIIDPYEDGTPSEGESVMPKDNTPPTTQGRRLLTFKQFLEMKKRMESVPPSPAALSRRPAERDGDPISVPRVKASL
jgi:hypothetical protein